MENEEKPTINLSFKTKIISFFKTFGFILFAAFAAMFGITVYRKLDVIASEKENDRKQKIKEEINTVKTETKEAKETTTEISTEVSKQKETVKEASEKIEEEHTSYVEKQTAKAEKAGFKKKKVEN